MCSVKTACSVKEDLVYTQWEEINTDTMLSTIGPFMQAVLVLPN